MAGGERERERERGRDSVCVIPIDADEGTSGGLGRGGVVDYLGYECQRTWKRKGHIKYAVAQIRMPGEGGRDPEPLAFSLFFKLSTSPFRWQPLCSVPNLF